ncbi:hypothetical protein C8R43DRAFT_1120883 [Mycena crocata]|nr:hypothetical protein C8R43DRAFT_1120883 [Mycena crocata]
MADNTTMTAAPATPTDLRPLLPKPTSGVYGPVPPGRRQRRWNEQMMRPFPRKAAPTPDAPPPSPLPDAPPPGETYTPPTALDISKRPPHPKRKAGDLPMKRGKQ